MSLSDQLMSNCSMVTWVAIATASRWIMSESTESRPAGWWGWRGTWRMSRLLVPAPSPSAVSMVCSSRSMREVRWTQLASSASRLAELIAAQSASRARLRKSNRRRALACTSEPSRRGQSRRIAQRTGRRTALGLARRLRLSGKSWSGWT